MNLSNRIAALENAIEKVQPAANKLDMVFIDEEGRIMDDGQAKTQPWVGCHYSELPERPAAMYGNIDPLVLLGKRPGIPEEYGQAFTEASRAGRLPVSRLQEFIQMALDGVPADQIFAK